MTHFKLIVLFLLLCSASIEAFAQKVKVACVGNSVTYGTGVADREVNSYPARLAKLLGEEYDVRNFGKPGATLLHKGHRPYIQQQEYQDALAFAPDWVVIHLGLNDTDPRNWPNYRDEFADNYIALIDTFRTLNPESKIWICRLTPIFHRHPRFKAGTRDWYWQIQAEIERIAKVAKVELIDLQEPLYNRPDLLPDALHPDKEGAPLIAEKVYGHLSGNYGGLKLPAIFTNKMVLQREKPLRIYGTANAGEKVTVMLGKQKRSSTTQADGKWEVMLKPMKAATDLQLTVKTATQEIQLEEVMIGEVWICSGQSNMAWMMKQSANTQADIEKGTAHVRLYQMEPRVITNAISWDSIDLAKLNQLDYYLPTTWKEADATSVANFSAVAYYFGKMLADSLNVPVGLICNAVGGAPTEAFIDRKTVEHDPVLVDMLYNWSQNPMVQDWVRERGAQNIKNSSNKAQRHPYETCYLYETGIKPLVGFTMRGVIWYQGESNAHHVELHEKLFPALVKSWRTAWGEEFPFYAVQLSSMERPSWPHFRDSQRLLAQQLAKHEIVVSSDQGHPTDVHPRNKRPIGERLGVLALNNCYAMSHVVPQGPTVKTVQFTKQGATLTFMYGEGLQTADGQAVRTFELAGKDGKFYPAEATIEGTSLKLTSRQVKKPAAVRYGWQPYTTANLVNGAGLPMSTFNYY